MFLAGIQDFSVSLDPRSPIESFEDKLRGNHAWIPDRSARE
jgi:hypothetical protein